MKDFYEAVKPGMVRGNIIVAAAAFLFASHPIDWVAFLALCLGLALVIASACVLNNIYDRHIDAKMERTKNRPLASGALSPTKAFVFGLVLVVLGVCILYFFSNALALACALLGFVTYVLLYTPLKHKTGHSLFVGALAGAMPPIAGYAAATNTLDIYAFGLFLFLFLWQIPHFVAIALYRFDEYQAAGVPLIITKSPSEKTRHVAKKIFHYSLVFLLLSCVLLVASRFLLA